MKILHLPDAHAGHPKVSAFLLHKHFHEFVYPELKKNIDLLVIGGDFFHTLLDMNCAPAFYVNSIIHELKELAINHKFLIRVLRGTFTHDRLQNQMFKIEGEDDSVVKIINTPCVEKLDEFDITILYKPDDLPQKDTWGELLNILEKSGIDKVDILINHGYFSHMVPDNIPGKIHGVLSWDDVKHKVLGFVLNGHVHTPGVYEKVVSGGSFERLAHGEEEAKGFFIVDYDPSTKHSSFEFIENTHALLFKTINLTNIDNPIEEFENWINKIEIGEADDLHVRVFSSNTTIKNALNVILRNKYPEAKLKIVKEGTIDVEDPEMISLVRKELPIITPDNLPGKLTEHIKQKHDIDIPVNVVEHKLSSLKEAILNDRK